MGLPTRTSHTLIGFLPLLCLLRSLLLLQAVGITQSTVRPQDWELFICFARIVFTLTDFTVAIYQTPNEY